MANEATNNEPVAKVEDYYDKIHRATWVRRVAGTMTGATLGAGFGAVVGIVASFLPYALGALGVAGASAVALPGLLAVASAAALFAGAGAFIGIALASDVGANAGSIAAGLEEKEKRENAKAIAQGVSPELLNQPTQEPKVNGNSSPQNFSWRVAGITAPLFAAFGGLIAANPHPAVSSALAMMTGSAGGLAGPAAMAASAIIFGMFGSFIGCKNAKFSNQLSNFYSKLITDKYFTEEPAKAAEPQLAPVKEPKLVPVYAGNGYELDNAPQKQHAKSEKRFSLESLIAREDKTSSPEMAWTRN